MASTQYILGSIVFISSFSALALKYDRFLKTYSIGPSVRWYFYDVGKWAFSLTQNLTYAYQQNRYPQPHYKDASGPRGLRVMLGVGFQF